MTRFEYRREHRNMWEMTRFEYIREHRNMWDWIRIFIKEKYDEDIEFLKTISMVDVKRLYCNRCNVDPLLYCFACDECRQYCVECFLDWSEISGVKNMLSIEAFDEDNYVGIQCLYPHALYTIFDFGVDIEIDDNDIDTMGEIVVYDEVPMVQPSRKLYDIIEKIGIEKVLELCDRIANLPIREDLRGI